MAPVPGEATSRDNVRYCPGKNAGKGLSSTGRRCKDLCARDGSSKTSLSTKNSRQPVQAPGAGPAPVLSSVSPGDVLIRASLRTRSPVPTASCKKTAAKMEARRSGAVMAQEPPRPRTASAQAWPKATFPTKWRFCCNAGSCTSPVSRSSFTGSNPACAPANLS